MALTPDLIKLIAISGGGLIIGIVGQVIIIKKKKEKQNLLNGYSDESPSQSEDISQNEQTAKDYINQYKSQYSKDSIKSGLLGMGISDSEAKDYLDKYM